jgi:hypothetical protein
MMTKQEWEIHAANAKAWHVHGRAQHFYSGFWEERMGSRRDFFLLIKSGSFKNKNNFLLSAPP